MFFFRTNGCFLLDLAGKHKGYEYSRTHNLTRQALENNKVKDALELITKTGYSNIPFMDGRQSMGSIKENRLLGKLVEEPALYNSPIHQVMDESLPILDAKTNIDDVKKYLKNNSAILVSDFGLITDIITRYDLINLNV